MELDNMAKLSDKCNIQVPIEVLNLIDDGKNPDEFTKDVLNKNCIAKNQVTKGKSDAFKVTPFALLVLSIWPLMILKSTLFGTGFEKTSLGGA
jgi:hypothetical protein